jgi:hypothetical protein
MLGIECDVVGYSSSTVDSWYGDDEGDDAEHKEGKGVVLGGVIAY